MPDLSDLLERADHAVGGVPLPAAGFEGIRRRRDRKRRNQKIRAGVLGVAVALAVALSIARALLTADPLPADSPSVEPLADLGTGAFFVDIRTGEASPLPSSITSIPGAGNFDSSPDGSMILFDNAGNRPRSSEPGLHQIYVATIDGTGVRLLTDDPVGAVEGRWSPDGTNVVYLGGRDPADWRRLPIELTVVDVATGDTTVVFTDRAARDIEAPSFSPDGRSILVWRGHLGYRRHLWAVPLTGGDPEPILEGQDRYDGSFSPDGSAFALQRLSSWSQGNAGGTCSELWLSDADGGDERRLTRCDAGERLSGATLQGGWSPAGARIAYGVRQFFTAGAHRQLFVLDVRTGHSTLLSAGIGQDWLDDETLIVVHRAPDGGA
jgi:Tol biopolymer transport system component